MLNSFRSSRRWLTCLFIAAALMVPSLGWAQTNSSPISVEDLARMLDVPETYVFVKSILTVSESGNATVVNTNYGAYNSNKKSGKGEDAEGIIEAMQELAFDVNTVMNTVKSAKVTIQNSSKVNVEFQASLSVGGVKQSPETKGKISPSKSASLTYQFKQITLSFPVLLSLRLKWSESAGKIKSRTFYQTFTANGATFSITNNLLRLK